MEFLNNKWALVGLIETKKLGKTFTLITLMCW